MSVTNKENSRGSLSYRPDIDGLRALAVSLVILYHADLNLFPGGFVGVDVFFVISGYLITSIILRELGQQAFTFRHFYKRRIARILPIFYTVSFTSLLLAYLLFTPNDLMNFADSMRYAAGFLSNIYFYKTNGYFAPASELLPLLHTWSLAIEEQFYVFWPLLVVIGYKYLSRDSTMLILCISVVGLIAYSSWQTVHNSDSAYYLLPGRSFELLLGAILAFIHLGQAVDLRSRLSNELLASLGLALILGSALLLSRYSVFPGINALWPCLGAALLIHSGRHSATFVHQLLGSRPIVFVGLISYSMYLWHWPVLAFGRYVSNDFTIFYALISIVFTLLLSVLSWRFIEQPLRKTHDRSFRFVLVAYFLIPLIFTVSICKYIGKHNGIPERLAANVVELSNVITSDFTADNQQNNIHKFPAYSDPVLLGDIDNPEAPLNTVIWGDSHVQHFKAFMRQAGQHYGFVSSTIMSLSCQPLLGTYRLRHGLIRDKCKATNLRAKTAIQADGIEFVYIAARWRLYAETSRNPGESANPTFIGDKISLEQSRENARRVFRSGLLRTIEYIISLDKIPIIFMQVPPAEFDTANCNLRQLQYPNLNNRDCNVNYTGLEKRLSFQNDVFIELKVRYPELKIIDYESILCSKEVCFSLMDNLPLYRDHNHLNGQGSEFLATKYLERFQLEWLSPVK